MSDAVSSRPPAVAARSASVIRRALRAAGRGVSSTADEVLEKSTRDMMAGGSQIQGSLTQESIPLVFFFSLSLSNGADYARAISSVWVGWLAPLCSKTNPLISIFF